MMIEVKNGKVFLEFQDFPFEWEFANSSFELESHYGEKFDKVLIVSFTIKASNFKGTINGSSSEKGCKGFSDCHKILVNEADILYNVVDNYKHNFVCSECMKRLIPSDKWSEFQTLLRIVES